MKAKKHRKTRRVRRSGRGGLSQGDMYSALLDLKKIQGDVKKNINEFINKELLRIKRPIIKTLSKMDIHSGDVALLYKKHMEKVEKEYGDAIQRTVLARMPSGQHTSQHGEDTKQ